MNARIIRFRSKRTKGDRVAANDVPVATDMRKITVATDMRKITVEINGRNHARLLAKAKDWDVSAEDAAGMMLGQMLSSKKADE